jgi:hypothetical protein
VLLVEHIITLPCNTLDTFHMPELLFFIRNVILLIINDKCIRWCIVAVIFEAIQRNMITDMKHDLI